MNPEQLPKSNNDQYDPNLEAQDEDVTSGGNNRLMYILVGVILALVVAYIALPKGKGEGMSSVTPSFMLDDAAVIATAPTAADSIAAGLKAAPATTVAATTEAPATTTKTTTRTTTTASTAPAAAATAAAAPVAAAPAAPEPEPAPAAAPAPAAPTNVTLTGKIEDENGRPLAGATVMLKGSSKAASTDASGNYSLEVPSGAENMLVYGYGGYDDEVVRMSSNRNMNVTLTPRAKTKKRR